MTDTTDMAKPLSGHSLKVSPVTLRLPCGTLQGSRFKDVQRFLGIPFAKPPVGELRFKAPHALPDWTGVRPANRFACAAIQPPRPAALLPEDPGYSEDCLYLNVWAPTAAGPHPVYVWIHGGANAAGTTAQPIFDGESFARRGVVFVSIAYRLGVLGFVDLSGLLGDAYQGSGNNGLRDQIEALKWVRRNIATFGGDPERVTIGGESAGGKNVISLLAAPQAKGLFQRAICQSGGGQTYADQATAHDLAKRVLAHLEGTVGRPEALLAVNTQSLLAAQAAVIKEYPAKSPFRAVIDGVVLNQAPLGAIAEGVGKHIPLLLGSNKDEAAFYGPSLTGDGKAVPQDLANMPAPDFDQTLAQYQRLFPDVDAETLRFKALTAESYGIPTLRLAEARAQTGEPAYMYRFDLAPEQGALRGLCVHTSELALVFGNMRLPTAAAIGPVEPLAHHLGEVMHSLWVDFISAGPTLAQPNGQWPRYDLPSRRVMIFGKQQRVESDPDLTERRIWEHWQAVL